MPSDATLSAQVVGYLNGLSWPGECIFCGKEVPRDKFFRVDAVSIKDRLIEAKSLTVVCDVSGEVIKAFDRGTMDFSYGVALGRGVLGERKSGQAKFVFDKYEGGWRLRTPNGPYIPEASGGEGAPDHAPASDSPPAKADNSPRPSTITKPTYVDYKDVQAFDNLTQQTTSTDNKLAEIDRMIARGFDLNGQTSDGETPIRSLMDYGQVELVAPLVARGLSVDSSTRSCADQFWFAQSGASKPHGVEVLAALTKAGFREDCLKSQPGDQGFVCGVMFGSGMTTFDVTAAVKAVDGIASLGFNVGARCLGKTIVERIEGNPDQAVRQRLEPIAVAIRRRTMK